MKLTWILYIFVILLVILSICRGSLVNEATVIEAVENQGYSNADVTDHAWFFIGYRGCDDHDAARFTITAINPIGQEVEIYACSGFPFKGITIRS